MLDLVSETIKLIELYATDLIQAEWSINSHVFGNETYVLVPVV